MRYTCLILLTLCFFLEIMSQDKQIQVQCNPVTGLCEIPDFTSAKNPIAWHDDEEIIYIGDPMCSWCWGMSPQINALKRYATQKHIQFNIIMGGLRPGGGEAWNSSFKNYLKHHWQEVNKKSGQPFDLALFEKDEFNYDTAPACRAVVSARTLAPEKALAFYELVQHYFYAKSKDPKTLNFYKPICQTLHIDFKAFSDAFSSKNMKILTEKDFDKSRALGVQGFPSILYRNKGKLYTIARGYTEFDRLKKSIQKIKLKN